VNRSPSVPSAHLPSPSQDRLLRGVPANESVPGPDPRGTSTPPAVERGRSTRSSRPSTGPRNGFSRSSTGNYPYFRAALLPHAPPRRNHLLTPKLRTLLGEGWGLEAPPRAPRGANAPGHGRPARPKAARQARRPGPMPSPTTSTFFPLRRPAPRRLAWASPACLCIAGRGGQGDHVREGQRSVPRGAAPPHALKSSAPGGQMRRRISPAANKTRSSWR